MLELVSDKKHDESRQGEAWAPLLPQMGVLQEKILYRKLWLRDEFCRQRSVASILHDNGFGATRNVEEADLIFINTCSIREKAEQTVRKRLTEFRKLKKQKPGMLVGVLGCMAERLKAKFLEEEKLVDLVVGPMPTAPCRLIEEAETGRKR